MTKQDEKKFLRRNELDYNRKVFSKFFEKLDEEIESPVTKKRSLTLEGDKIKQMRDPDMSENIPTVVDRYEIEQGQSKKKFMEILEKNIEKRTIDVKKRQI